MTTTYEIVRHGPFSVGIEVVGAHPNRVWLLGWLRDHVVRDPRLKRPALEAARVLAELVEQQWGTTRAYRVEVEWADRLGTVRVERREPEASPGGPRPH